MTIFQDFRKVKINRSIGNNNTSSSFIITFDSPFGRHKNDFSIGQDITIKVDFSDPPQIKIFTGIIEKISFQGQGERQKVVLTGRDYSARLQDVTVEPIVYTNSEVSTIVTNIIDNEVDDITTINVNVTTTTLERISFNHKSVFDAIQQLAELSGFIFFVDENKDLHFERDSSIDSGVILDNLNIISMDFDEGREGMANQVWVYGDRQLSSIKEVLVSGTAPSDTGSDYTLTYKPHNTSVESSDFTGSILKGGILNILTTPTSGPDYLVNFEDRQLVFVSGTTLGYNTIPAGSIIINYERDIPIVKFGTNRASILAFGPKELVITDKSIKDPQAAKDILFKKLDEADPLNRFESKIKGWFTFNPGDTLLIDMPDYSISNKRVRIIDISYEFDKEKLESQTIIKVRLDKKVLDITDEIKNLKQNIKSLQTDLQASTDFLTRFEFSIGSAVPVGSIWFVQTTTVVGSVSHLYSTNFTPPLNPFNLASGTDEGNLAGSFTGSAVAFTALSPNVSGGFNYGTL